MILSTSFSQVKMRGYFCSIVFSFVDRGRGSGESLLTSKSNPLLKRYPPPRHRIRKGKVCAIFFQESDITSRGDERRGMRWDGGSDLQGGDHWGCTPSVRKWKSFINETRWRVLEGLFLSFASRGGRGRVAPHTTNTNAQSVRGQPAEWP